MRYSSQIKPISFIKANAAEVLDELEKSREPIVVTQNGEARAVLLDVRSYEESQETLALLKILALGRKQIETGEVHSLSEAIRSIRKSLADREEGSAA
jgi:prevent-host-death family protein